MGGSFRHAAMLRDGNERIEVAQLEPASDAAIVPSHRGSLQ
jgi:hypothetical protein